MMKRARPCKHVRRVKTKKGRKSVVVNRKVKKRRNFGGFAGKTTVPAFDYPGEYGYEVEKKLISPDEYMRLARQAHSRSELGAEEYEKQTVTGHRRPYTAHKSIVVSPEEYARYAKAKEHGIDSIKAGLHHKKKVVPMPFIEFRNGIPVEQEGRHRAVAAREMGYKKIPVVFARKKV